MAEIGFKKQIFVNVCKYDELNYFNIPDDENKDVESSLYDNSYLIEMMNQSNNMYKYAMQHDGNVQQFDVSLDISDSY